MKANDASAILLLTKLQIESILYCDIIIDNTAIINYSTQQLGQSTQSYTSLRTGNQPTGELC